MILSYTKFYKLMSDPLVFVITTGWSFSSGISLCLKEAGGRPCHVLVQCYWHGSILVGPALAFKRQSAQQYPNIKLTYLCNTLGDVKLFQAKGVEAVYIHQNAFIDDRIFKINSVAEKKFAAIHIANVQALKRHDLAGGISSIAVITYDPSEEQNYSELDHYKDLGFINCSEDGSIHPLSRVEVAKIIQHSNSGLILSKKEGANFASAEYLLTGIPVVSTPSIGGRAEFFDSRHVKIVEPNAVAVEQAVAEWALNPPPAEEVRESVLKKCREHRRRLLDFLGEISKNDVYADVDENYWSPLFVDKLTLDVPVSPEDMIELWAREKWQWRIYKKVRAYFK